MFNKEKTGALNPHSRPLHSDPSVQNALSEYEEKMKSSGQKVVPKKTPLRQYNFSEMIHKRHPMVKNQKTSMVKAPPPAPQPRKLFKPPIVQVVRRDRSSFPSSSFRVPTTFKPKDTSTPKHNIRHDLEFTTAADKMITDDETGFNNSSTMIQQTDLQYEKNYCVSKESEALRARPNQQKSVEIQTDKESLSNQSPEQQSLVAEKQFPHTTSTATNGIATLNVSTHELPWTNREQLLLEAALKKHSQSLGSQYWDKIADSVPTRTKNECLARVRHLSTFYKNFFPTDSLMLLEPVAQQTSNEMDVATHSQASVQQITTSSPHSDQVNINSNASNTGKKVKPEKLLGQAPVSFGHQKIINQHFESLSTEDQVKFQSFNAQDKHDYLLKTVFWCQICKQNEAFYFHYLVLSCTNCKDIFGRNGRHPELLKCKFSDNSCDITTQRKRMKCVKCWVDLCISNGMCFEK